MARRADHTRDELKELAIVAGLELIRQEGLSHFSARALAARIGYTVGTLYNVFGTYDDMMLHINGRTLDTWYAFMQQALAKKRGNPLHALARAYIAFSRTHHRQWHALFEYHFDEGRELPQWYVVKMGRFFVLAEELLVPMVDGNQRKAKRCAHVLWAGIHGICMLALSDKLSLVEADSAETLALSLIDNYMAGLARGRNML